jgi:hypothetical protein
MLDALVNQCHQGCKLVGRRPQARIQNRNDPLAEQQWVNDVIRHSN